MQIWLEGQYWSAGPHLQLYPKFCHGVQPLLPYVWETTHLPINVTLGYNCPLPPSTCRNWGNELSGPIGKPTSFSRRRHGTISIIMINGARQYPWGLETWSWSVSLPSRANTKSRVAGRKWEYVVEQQPYPNLPVYVVCPIDGEGCSHTLHWNFLLSHQP